MAFAEFIYLSKVVELQTSSCIITNYERITVDVRPLAIAILPKYRKCLLVHCKSNFDYIHNYNKYLSPGLKAAFRFLSCQIHVQQILIHHNSIQQMLYVKNVNNLQVSRS